MKWRIESYKTDVAEISSNDHQNIYTVNLLNESNDVISSAEAYGRNHRTTVTKAMIAKHGQYITKIEHNE